MDDWFGFAIRNPSYVTKNVRRSWAVRKAMKAYREDNPSCEWCGREKKLEVHHDIPVAIAPGLAASRSNLRTMCKPCHRVVAHGNNFHTYESNLDALVAAREPVQVLPAE